MAFEIRYKPMKAKQQGWSLLVCTICRLSPCRGVNALCQREFVSVEPALAVGSTSIVWKRLPITSFHCFIHPSTPALPKLPKIDVNSNSELIWFGPRRCEWLRASLSAHNCQQHERLPRIHVELYGLIHERILLSAVVFVRVENRGKKFFLSSYPPRAAHKWKVQG